MRVSAVLKIALVASAVALTSSFSGGASAAKMMKLPPGACAFEKKVVADGAVCAYNCDPTTMWCAQNWCLNGQLTPIVSCYGPFCPPKCGG